MRILLFFLPLLLFSVPLLAQDKPVIDGKTKVEIVNTVASIMQEQYLYADVGEKMSEHIKKKLETGAYDPYDELKPFCKKLTSDLRDICHDKHIFVFYSPKEAYEVRARKKMLPEEEIKEINDRYLEKGRRDNFGFKKVEILEGNIGYLDLRYFSSPETFKEVTPAVIKFLSNSDAIIIDLRKNGGGSSGKLLASYFLPSEKIYLGSTCCRDTTQNVDSWNNMDIPGKRLSDIDLYILTGPRTFSAAEDFAYTLKHLDRAVIVGEKTKGGAHPIDVLIVKGDILTQVSICESYNPITKKNWEGVGVQPDVEVSSAEALKTAQIIALKNIIGNTSDLKYSDTLRKLLTQLKKQH